MKGLTLEQRFWSKVVKSDGGGCWLFSGKSDKYGQLAHAKRTILAHRFSYEIHHGAIPVGMFVCHKCDVRGCVNPSHLYAGTHEDNKRDMIDRQRLKRPRGSSHNATTEDFREQVRKEYALGGVTQQQLANKYGRTQATISQIIRHYPRNRTDNGGKNRTGFFKRFLSPEQHGEIRELYQSGAYTQVELAKRYNCTQTHVSRIVNKSLEN